MATPSYILRGHASEVAALAFTWHNRLLLSADSSGFIIAWAVAYWRPIAVWKAHTASIITIAPLAPLQLLSHGRDGRLKLWSLKPLLGGNMSTITPVAELEVEREPPPLLREWIVNTLNFCSFAHLRSQVEEDKTFDSAADWQGCIAIPNGVDPEAVSILHSTSSIWDTTLKPPNAQTKGMVMAVTMFNHCEELYMVAAYESGTVTVFRGPDSKSLAFLAEAKIHIQPPLSLLFNPVTSNIHSTGADALISSIPIPNLSAPSISPTTSSSPSPTSTPCPAQLSPVMQNTKHAGQESLRLRSDGRLLATAGWDGRARVYAANSLGELAVLKWHKGGLRSLAFAEVFEHGEETIRRGADAVERHTGKSASSSLELSKVNGDRESIARRMVNTEPRQMQKYMKHWIAVGGKDSKISLWDIY